MLIVAEPEVAQQLIQNTHKHAVIKNFMPPLGGDHSLVSMDGKEWLKWRKIFNPGFSLTNLLTLVPGIVEDALTFCEVLEEHARKEISSGWRKSRKHSSPASIQLILFVQHEIDRRHNWKSLTVISRSIGPSGS